MQPTPNLAPPPLLTARQHAALIEALTKGGMPELFFPSVVAQVERILREHKR